RRGPLHRHPLGRRGRRPAGVHGGGPHPAGGRPCGPRAAARGDGLGGVQLRPVPLLLHRSDRRPSAGRRVRPGDPEPPRLPRRPRHPAPRP
ncbi:hypothetical protein ALMP_30240, partial [Streptomyces sp. A012304]